MKTQRHTLRNTLRQQRRLISSTSRDKFSRQLLSQLLKKQRLISGAKIATYLPHDGEIDTKYINNFFKKAGFSAYLPVLVGKKLKFAKVGKCFKKNKFGIFEPIDTPILNTNQLNIILIPLVGFDANKNRLGMGGGFYDRTLAFKKRQKTYNNPKLIGLAFDCQQVDKLKTQPWDVPLNAVITPTTYYQ